jgi:hypothetical protein
VAGLCGEKLGSVKHSKGKAAHRMATDWHRMAWNSSAKVLHCGAGDGKAKARRGVAEWSKGEAGDSRARQR